VPTTVDRSRLPWTLIRNTENPVSSLWNVIRFTEPQSRSWLPFLFTGALYSPARSTVPRFPVDVK
jgi:hypothetical protein